ncbi:MAG: beta-galactosidase [Treponema sp.]|jgi:beta-galactosidase|nr:beta-galactosidase [Treponema sp.]
MRYPPVVKNFPHILHGGDYNPEQWLKWKDTIWKEDMRLAKLAGINTLSVGIFSWTALEPEEGRYCFEWLDEVMDMLAAQGMVAVLATPSGARPAWMSKKYPEVLRVNELRLRNVHGERHNHCLSSPVYREKTRSINALLARRYKGHPALGVWHISNEYSGACHCPLCQAKFRAYLKNRYRTLDALNEAWWSAFWSGTITDWEQIESPDSPGNGGHNGLRLDWRRFTTDQFVDFYLNETAPLKEITPEVPCTTNLMAGYSGIDYARFAEVLDLVSWDSYPQWSGAEDNAEIGLWTSYYHDLIRGLKRRPFMLMESCPSATNWRPVAKLHRPGVHKLQSLQALAHGADTVQYFQFRKSRGGPEQHHGAVVDHGGGEHTRVFREIAELGECLKGLDDLTGADTPAKAALIYDYNVRWALDDAKGFLQGKTGYEATVVEHYRAFWKRGIPLDVIDSRQSLDKYSLVIAPMLYLLREGTAERIDAFVRRGGVFAATYATGYVNESALAFLGGFPGPLRETLGVWCEEIDALYPGEENAVEWGGRAYRAFDLCELIHAETAEVLGVYGGDFYAGRPALTLNRRGAGRAYFIAARTGGDFLDDLYRRAAEEAGVKPLFDELPEGVTAQIRGNGEKDFIFVMNFTNREKRVSGGAGMPGPAGSFDLGPFGVRIIERPAPRP